MNIKLSVLSLFLFLGFIACRKNNASDDITSTAHVKIIQQHIDSATALYNAAIADMNNGMAADTIVAKYSESVTRNHQQVKDFLEELGRMLQSGKLTKARYDELKSSLHFEAVQAKRNVLREKGIILVKKA